MEPFDYIVVGAGTAGCLLANRLSANPAHRVALLEAGGADNYPWIHIPVGYLYCIGNPRTDWLTQTEAEPGLHGRSIKYPRGRVLGGCSSINGMIYMRGQAGDYDDWVAQGCPGWGWNEVLPVFKQHENYHRLDGGASDPLHGHGGEWRVESQRLHWTILDSFRRAAEQTGIPPVEDFNRGDNFGCGYFEVNQRRGWRWNAAKAFLHPIKHRTNLTVITQAQVTRLVFTADADGRPRASGVEFLPNAPRMQPPGQGADGARSGAVQRLTARREVILAAGAVHSPALLQWSGVGDARSLQGLGIPVQLDRPQVGANLQDHLQLRTIFKVHGAKTLNRKANSLIGKASMALEYLVRRTGPMSMAPSQLGAFAFSAPHVKRPDLEYHVQPLSLDRFGEPLHTFDAMTASVCQLRPVSRGTISVRSANPFELPAIQPRFLSAEEDRKVAARAIELTRRIMSAPALQPYRPEEVLPGPSATTEAELEEAAGRIGTTIFHPVGTCRMGSDEGAVVDPQLRVRGVRGLRVADASVMPTITSGNTNSPTLMIAERAAAWILRDCA